VLYETISNPSYRIGVMEYLVKAVSIEIMLRCSLITVYTMMEGRE